MQLLLLYIYKILSYLQCEKALSLKDKLYLRFFYLMPIIPEPDLGRGTLELKLVG